MGNWVVYHRGTGTYFSVDDDAFAINVSELDDEKFNDFFDEHDLDEIVDTHGFRLSDELFDEVFNGEKE